MKYLYFSLLLLFFSFSSCTKNVKNKAENSVQDSVKVSTNRIIFSLAETLNPEAKKAVEDWKEYINVDDFLLRYYNISTTEALDNAEELSNLVKLMVDSVRVEKLKQLNVKARMNVLYNESLRLTDMAQISSITPQEVKQEVGNIIEVFSALNAKINTIYKAEDLQNSLEIDTETPVIEEREKLSEIEKTKVEKRISSKSQ